MRRILIIEDDPVIGRIYRSQFEKAGFEADLVADGQAGYYQLQEGGYDGVLLDLLLPNMGGLDILRKVRAQRVFQKLVVVVFTASFLSEHFDAAQEAGANRIFHKSNLTPKDLVDVMQEEFSFGRQAGAPGEQDPRRELIGAFLKRAPAALDALNDACGDFLAARSRGESMAHLRELFRHLQNFGSVAGLAGLGRLGQLTMVLETLLVAMHEIPGADTLSTRRTVRHAVDFLLQNHARLAGLPESVLESPARALVVDDEVMSRRAAALALELDRFEVATHEDARASLELLRKRSFQLVVIDETMPGFTGSQLLSFVRQDPMNQDTPVILILGAGEFEARAGDDYPGNLDVIARGYPFAELAVKALVLILASQLGQQQSGGVLRMKTGG